MPTKRWSIRAEELRVELTAAVATWPTRDLLMWTLVESTYSDVVGVERGDLTSPGAQLHYLKGLISRVPYRDGTQSPWEEIVSLLNAYFDATQAAYKTEAQQLFSNDAIVADAAFLKDFYHRRYWSELEAVTEADALFAHFAPLVRSDLACSPRDLINAGLWLRRELIDRSKAIAPKLRALKPRAEVEARIATAWGGRDEEARVIARQLRQDEGNLIYGAKLVTSQDLEGAVPGTGVALAQRLSLRRPPVEGAPLRLTDPNPIDDAPFIEVEPGVYFVPQMTNYWGAIARRMERAVIRGSSHPEDYFRRRAERLEERARLALQRALGSEARILPPQPTLLDGARNPKQDIVILWRDLLVVTECKSSNHPTGRTRPFTVHEHIAEWFESAKGVRGGFEQCNRVREAATRGPVRFAIAGGEVVEVHLPPERVRGICVLAEPVGFLSVQPAWVLDDLVPEEAPWAVGIADLEAFVRGLEYFGDGPDAFARRPSAPWNAASDAHEEYGRPQLARLS